MTANEDPEWPQAIVIKGVTYWPDHSVKNFFREILEHCSPEARAEFMKAVDGYVHDVMRAGVKTWL